jgi:hypothetical protein
VKSEDGKSILDITFKSMFDVILERPSKQHINGNKATCRLVASSSPILTPYCRNPYPVILSVLFRITVFCLDVYMGVRCTVYSVPSGSIFIVCTSCTNLLQVSDQPAKRGVKQKKIFT